MFEFKRLFRPALQQPRNGLAGDDFALLELLDLKLLDAETAAADSAARKPALPDHGAALLRQAAVWREVARRTGDVIALRKAASAAERAAGVRGRTAEGRLEQARCALQGVEMFGGEGLVAAADRALADALEATGPVHAAALGKRSLIQARQSLSRTDAMGALAALTGYDAATNLLNARGSGPAARLIWLEGRIERAVETLACARALKVDALAARACADLAEVIASLDPAYSPLSWSRAHVERAHGLVVLSALNDDPAPAAEAVETMGRVFDTLLRDHSPLDWARAQAALGEALWALARRSGLADAYAKASGAFDRAWNVVRDQPALRLRAEIGERRGALAVHIAVEHHNMLELDAAEAAFRCELASLDPHRDPVGWALCQLNLGRSYMARGEFGVLSPARRAGAALAISEAQAMFAEYGLDGVSEVAGAALHPN